MEKERQDDLNKKFHALSNQTRREILNCLNVRPQSAGEIARYFQITSASISYHLSLLKESGLISCCQIKRHRIYKIKREALDEVYLWLTKFVKDQN